MAEVSIHVVVNKLGAKIAQLEVDLAIREAEIDALQKELDDLRETERP